MAAFGAAAVFSDRCVLQRGKPINIFGCGEDGKIVEVELKIMSGGKELSFSNRALVEKGKWLTTLEPVSGGENGRLILKCEGSEITFNDIAVGEVWLLGGQSNMEFELQNCSTARAHLNAPAPDVRYYYTRKKGIVDEAFLRSEKNTAWAKFDPESAKCWSAAGFIFAKKLSQRLGVTVGLIGCNWGGTSASCWMPRTALAEDERTISYITDFETGIKGKSPEEQKREYDEYLTYAAEWDRKYGELLREKPGLDWAQAEQILGKNRWPGPINLYNPFRPGGLHEAMLKRVCPYSLRGFMFYQGESDDHKPASYYALFGRMIKAWRRDWGEALPFVFVQLPGHRYANDPDYKHWCLIREAQQRAANTLPGAAMISAIDCGEFNDIHPKDKEPIGDRLYRAALYNVYGLENAAFATSPQPEKIVFDKNKVTVYFDNVGKGLKIKSEDIFGFEIAGEDAEYKPAKAYLSENGKAVTVKSDAVPAPKYIRYLWTNYPERVDLYNSYDLPVAPFRSDEAEGSAQAAGGIRQIMEL